MKKIQKVSRTHIHFGVCASVLSILCAMPSFGATNSQITRLLQQKKQKMAQLEQCAQKVKGFKIAGISTLGLTAVGVGGNIALASKNKSLERDIDSTQTQIESEKGKLEKIQADIAAEELKQAKAECAAKGDDWMWQNGGCEQIIVENNTTTDTAADNAQSGGGATNTQSGDAATAGETQDNQNSGQGQTAKKSSLEECLERRKNMNKEVRACCYVGTNVAKGDEANQKCNCVNGGTFKFDEKNISKGGTCEVPGSAGGSGASATACDDLKKRTASLKQYYDSVDTNSCSKEMEEMYNKNKSEFRKLLEDSGGRGDDSFRLADSCGIKTDINAMSIRDVAIEQQLEKCKKNKGGESKSNVDSAGKQNSKNPGSEKEQSEKASDEPKVENTECMQEVKTLEAKVKEVTKGQELTTAEKRVIALGNFDEMTDQNCENVKTGLQNIIKKYEGRNKRKITKSITDVFKDTKTNIDDAIELIKIWAKGNNISNITCKKDYETDANDDIVVCETSDTGYRFLFDSVTDSSKTNMSVAKKLCELYGGQKKTEIDTGFGAVIRCEVENCSNLGSALKSVLKAKYTAKRKDVYNKNGATGQHTLNYSYCAINY